MYGRPGTLQFCRMSSNGNLSKMLTVHGCLAQSRCILSFRWSRHPCLEEGNRQVGIRIFESARVFVRYGILQNASEVFIQRELLCRRQILRCPEVQRLPIRKSAPSARLQAAQKMTKTGQAVALRSVYHLT